MVVVEAGDQVDPVPQDPEPHACAVSLRPFLRPFNVSVRVQPRKEIAHTNYNARKAYLQRQITELCAGIVFGSRASSI